MARQLKAGDPSAFADFYDRFAADLFSIVYVILHNPRETSDVLEQTFLQMWKRIATYDPTRSTLFTWAVMIARHNAIERLRARKRQARLVETDTFRTNNPPSTPIEHARNLPEWQRECERVRVAFEELSETEREAIDLAFFGGLTQTEISKKLGTPVSTVRGRISRGLLDLRNRLGEAAT
jgi:RNA polymerase sigma-70 factor (ECF subfamily)